jgi:indolepyruvate ferredoxin oxidoreductase beta subunit
MVRYGQKVYSPLIEKGRADLILAFEQLEGLRWLSFLKKKGLLVLCQEKIYPLPVLIGKDKYPEEKEIESILEKFKVNFYLIDAGKLAVKAGSKRSLNLVLLGFLAKFLNIPKTHWYRAIRERVPAKTVEINIKAFDLGYEQALSSVRQ